MFAIFKNKLSSEFSVKSTYLSEIPATFDILIWWYPLNYTMWLPLWKKIYVSFLLGQMHEYIPIPDVRVWYFLKCQHKDVS